MKTTIYKYIIISNFLFILFTSSLIYSQSSIIYDEGTEIDIGTGAEICAEVIVVNGTFNGNGTFCNTPVAVESDTLLVPTKFGLSQNYPNPFNPTTKINYQIPNSGKVSLKIYDVLGDEIATLVNEEKLAGNYEVFFNASHLSSGVYFYKIQSGSFISTKKMQLLK